MGEYEKGKVTKGTVTGIEDYGIFISLNEFYSGLVHISEVSHEYVKDIREFVKVGETINVEILDVCDKTFRLKLSIKNIPYKIDNSEDKGTIVKETSRGFSTLFKTLPIWIEKQIEKINQK